jgi:hypothetical protein
MPMAPYSDIDFSNRLIALRNVGFALGVGNASLPDNRAANSDRTYLKWINNIRVAQALPPLPNLDYTGFVPALNVLAALVP